MLQNAYFLAKIGADTAENEQHFAEILPKTGNYPSGEDREEGRDAALVEVAVGAPHDGRAAGAALRAIAATLRGREGRGVVGP